MYNNRSCKSQSHSINDKTMGARNKMYVTTISQGKGFDYSLIGLNLKGNLVFNVTIISVGFQN